MDFLLPIGASIPGCIIPSFLDDVCIAKSGSFSSNKIDISHFASSLAIAHPITPPPIISTSTLFPFKYESLIIGALIRGIFKPFTVI